MPKQKKAPAVLRKWSVVGVVTGGRYLGEYEAATKEEAEEMALNEHGGPISLCHHCVSECEDGEIHEAHAEAVKDEA